MTAAVVTLPHTSHIASVQNARGKKMKQTFFFLARLTVWVLAHRARLCHTGRLVELERNPKPLLLSPDNNRMPSRCCRQQRCCQFWLPPQFCILFFLMFRSLCVPCIAVMWYLAYGILCSESVLTTWGKKKCKQPTCGCPLTCSGHRINFRLQRGDGTEEMGIKWSYLPYGCRL